MKCWGCNADKISLFPWLSGDNLCKDCLQNPGSPEVTKNYIENSTAIHDKNVVRDEKAAKQAEKITRHGKNVLSFVFGGAALLWFVVMLPAQPDFIAIVIGWSVIAVIYAIFRISSR